MIWYLRCCPIIRSRHTDQI